jgi:hypothetical protein
VKTVHAILRARNIDPSAQKFNLGILDEGYAPLVIKSIGTGPTGHPAVSVCQYAAQGLKMVREREMRFEIIRDSEKPDHMIWTPYYYGSDYRRCEQVAIWLNENGEAIVDDEILKNQIEVALMWDLMLAEEGL